MATFNYAAVDPHGQPTSGEVSAADMGAARQLLESRGLTVQSIQLGKSSAVSRSADEGRPPEQEQQRPQPPREQQRPQREQLQQQSQQQQQRLTSEAAEAWQTVCADSPRLSRLLRAAADDADAPIRR